MTKISLYNTLTRKKEEFGPIEKGKAGFYHCGPTVYWTQHIGNLRGMACGDIVVRVLRYAGHDVVHVRNYTDVGHLTSEEDEGEDKMDKGARRDKSSPQEIANKYIKIFEQDTAELNILEPTHKPRATENIKEIIKMTEVLLSKGYAYFTDLAVYFDVSKAQNYTQLSGQNLEEKIAGAGSANVSDPQKKHPADFALWFFKAGKHKNALQFWSSPFNSPLVEKGEGFPGWHIECSVMGIKHLGEQFDIHMGGVEHIPVHHTNEIAQSESYTGKTPWVNYWLHNEHLLVNGKKMSKSEGTGYSLAEIKEKSFHPLALRYFFLQAHYRSKQNFTWEAMRAAQNGLDHLYNQVRELGREQGEINKEFKNKFFEVICDDLNTPQALAVVQELLKSDLPKEDKLSTVLDFDKVLGLDLKIITTETKTPDNIKKLLDSRQKARDKKNWEESDRLRDEIKKGGYLVEDTEEGMRVTKK